MKGHIIGSTDDKGSDFEKIRKAERDAYTGLRDHGFNPKTHTLKLEGLHGRDKHPDEEVGAVHYKFSVHQGKPGSRNKLSQEEIKKHKAMDKLLSEHGDENK